MATIVRVLWARGDESPFILGVDAARRLRRFEQITNHLEETGNRPSIPASSASPRCPWLLDRDHQPAAPHFVPEPH
jgi:hypothetical protein